MNDIASRSWAYNKEMELYHALNRGVDGRDIFLDSQDYARFVHNLYAFNDRGSSENLHRFLKPQMNDIASRSSRTRERLVDIHGWCLMRNHFHLLISERGDGGIPLFFKKVNIGYAKYFNERYRRQGALFQGRTKKIPVEHEPHFLYILHYIHLNPLDYLKGFEKWRIRSKAGIDRSRDALEHLKTYRWSSYLDYCGIKNFPSIVSFSLFEKKNYGQELASYLHDAEYPLERLTLE